VSSGRWEAVSAPQSAGRIPTSESKLASKPAGTRAVRTVRVMPGDLPIEPGVVSISARSHDDVLEYTHAFVVAYSRGRFRSAIVQPLSVATYELLGNALNYGSVLGEIAFQLTETPESVAVRVSNDTVPVRINMLCLHVERMSKSPEAVFVEEMGKSVAVGASKPMLGLVRVVHEAKMSLEVYVRGTRVTTIARITN